MTTGLFTIDFLAAIPKISLGALAPQEKWRDGQDPEREICCVCCTQRHSIAAKQRCNSGCCRPHSPTPPIPLRFQKTRQNQCKCLRNLTTCLCYLHQHFPLGCVTTSTLKFTPIPNPVTNLTLPQSIVHNGHVYKSLAAHEPESRNATSEHDKLYQLDSAWEICPKTPDALEVCAKYPWAAYALVFADGSAHWTALAPVVKSSFKPGTCTLASVTCQHNKVQVRKLYLGIA